MNLFSLKFILETKRKIILAFLSEGMFGSSNIRRMLNDTHLQNFISCLKNEIWNDDCGEIPKPLHYPPAPDGTVDVEGSLGRYMLTTIKEEDEESNDDDSISSSKMILIDDNFQGEEATFTNDYTTDKKEKKRPTTIDLSVDSKKEEIDSQRDEIGPELPSEDIDLSYSFACGGWLQFYMFGVAKCLKDHRMHKKAIYLGSSAGALTGLGLAVEEGSYDDAVKYCKEVCIPQCRGTFLGPFKLDKYVKGCLDYSAQLGGDNWTKTIKKLYVTTTSVPGFQSRRQTFFKSKEDLETHLLASAAAFPLAPPVKYNDLLLIDGGLGDFQPLHNEFTVTINPFYFSRADIKPSRYVPAWWALLPPSDPDTIDWLYDLGYCDGLRWLKNLKDSKSLHIIQKKLTPCNSQISSKGNKERSLKSTNKTEVTNENDENDDVYIDTVDIIDRYKIFCSDPEDILTCSKRPSREPHHYDERHNISLNRFLGYGTWPKLFDFFTIIFVALIWRTMAYMAIYIELILKTLFLTLRNVWYEMKRYFPEVILIFAAFFPYFLPLAKSILLMVIYRLVKNGPTNEIAWRHLMDLIPTLLSLSLLLRSVPLIGSRVKLKKHHKLYRQSFCYRVLIHFI